MDEKFRRAFHIKAWSSCWLIMYSGLALRKKTEEMVQHLDGLKKNRAKFLTNFNVNVQ